MKFPRLISPARTINDLFTESCQRFADSPAMGFAFQEPLSYRQLQQRVQTTAAALQARNLRPGDRVALLAENSPWWGIAYLAIVRLGAVAVPILPDFPASDVRHILLDAGAGLLFTSQRQLEKLYDCRRQLKAIITLDDSHDRHQVLRTEPFSRFLASAAQPARERMTPSAVRPDDLASIIYTSGTSGHSKAVMLSHGNFTSNVRAIRAIITDPAVTGWTFLSILPMSHAYEFTTSFLLPLAYGGRIVYAGKTPTPTILEKICRHEHPTIMCMVPMVMEKIYKKKLLPAIQGNPLLRAAMKVPFLRRRLLRAVGRKLREFFGGELKFAAIGGAALNPEVEAFLFEADFPYLCGYGLTEASPLVSAGPFADPTVAVGSSGKPVRGVEVRIADPDPVSGLGEILVRGPNVMQGYYKNTEATRAAIDQDGWLATGDLGYLDEQRNLFIEGRLKSVIVLSHGENIYPENIEEKINAFPEVNESLVTADGDRLLARIHLDYELIDDQTTGRSEQQKLRHIQDLLRRIQREVNRQLPIYSQLHRVVERREPFTKTATHKIKRYLYSNGKVG